MNSLVHKLDSLERRDQKGFWKLLKSIKKQEGLDDKLPKLDKLFQYFKSVHQDSCTNAFDAQVFDKIEKFVNDYDGNNIVAMLDKPIDLQEVNKCIKELSSGKAHGCDLITNEMLKTAPISRQLVYGSYSTCLQIGWKTGTFKLSPHHH